MFCQPLYRKLCQNLTFVNFCLFGNFDVRAPQNGFKVGKQCVADFRLFGRFGSAPVEHEENPAAPFVGRYDVSCLFDKRHYLVFRAVYGEPQSFPFVSRGGFDLDDFLFSSGCTANTLIFGISSSRTTSVPSITTIAFSFSISRYCSNERLYKTY